MLKARNFLKKQMEQRALNRAMALPAATGLMVVGSAVPALASESSTVTTTGTITGMLEIFSQLFAWILNEGATLLAWMLDKPILMISMGLFFCGAIIGFLIRIYRSV